jgi:hypothetical protein
MAVANVKGKAITRQQKMDLGWINRIDPDLGWEGLDIRIKRLQVKRDIRFFDRYVLNHTGEKVMRIYQLKMASPLVYLQRAKIQKTTEEWMRLEGCYTEAEIVAWSTPRFEWPEERITPEQERVLWEWREKHDIKDRTDWGEGITLSTTDKAKLDKYRQVSGLQPRQTGKSEIVVRVDIYVKTNVQHFASAVFAPTEDQAKDFIFQRTRDYIEENPFYKGRFKTLNALDMTFNGPEHPKFPASGSSFSAVSASPGANIEGDSLDWAILDESQDITDYKVKKSIKFMMAAKKGSMIKIGTVNTVKGHFWEATTKKGSKFWHQVIIHPDICAATNEWWAEFIENSIEEDGRWSDTIRMSVFLEWMLSLGMFITEDEWKAMVDESLDWIPYHKKGLQFATIDVAKTRDETVCMVGLVDQSITIAGRHPVRLLNVITLPGVDYDSQYEEIKRWLDNNYSVAAIGIDDTGGRGGLADRFMKTQYRVEAFTYTSPGKSEWYTNLQTMKNSNFASVKAGNLADRLIRIPGTETAQKQKIYRDFEEQMQSLVREYKQQGKILKVNHPDIEGAKDDYPDTFMMLTWMASRVHISLDEMLEHVGKASETEMDKMEWEKDEIHDKGQQRANRSRNRKNMQEDEDLLEISGGASDLDSVW